MKQRPDEQPVEILIGANRLQGMLCVPDHPRGIVLFAHGSGSGRLSPRNNFVARHLQQGQMATLLMDLLEELEAEDRRNVFDIPLLAKRLLGATTWLAGQSKTERLRVGYFGASTGAGAALQAAAQAPDRLAAVVSRGGRPDLAAAYLPNVTAPTLLIVGGDDEPVIEMNREALALLACPKQLIIVPGASHLFEEPGTLERVAALALDWFQRYLSPPS
ncbi:MAG TPA: dienelactone hydrolase family protein [Nitrospiraceae bacterium]|nr:dienelactone hydrolase family protein [Nitrospiraceae bacterium]